LNLPYPPCGALNSNLGGRGDRSRSIGVDEMSHAFSVEMKCREHVKNMSLSKGAQQRVLFEGCLGELEELSLIEGAVLEVKGVNGVLRIDLSEDELRKICKKMQGKK
jgi:hypothetical protein